MGDVCVCCLLFCWTHNDSHLDKLVDERVREGLIHLECVIKKHILHTANYINDFKLGK